MPHESFLQVVLAETDGRRSGAELRNSANLATASRFLPGTSFPLARLAHGPRRARIPTVATLDRSQVGDLLDTIATREPTIVIFEGVALLDALAATRRAFPRLRLVLDCHNVESVLEAEIRRSRLPIPLRFMAPILHRKAVQRCRAADREAARLADAVWFCSRADLEAARRLFALPPARVVPNPIPPWVHETAEPGDETAAEVLFIGHLGYRPNRRAVHELCSEIMPRLHRERSDVRLHVCGRGPASALVRTVEAAGGRLTADPDDLRDAYRRAAVVAAPLREGGGTRIKVIEALALGKAVVATAKAVEGLGLTPGTHYTRAETARDFAAGIARLMADRAAARALGERGRAFVADAFGPAAREAAFRDALRSVTGQTS